MHLSYVAITKYPRQANFRGLFSSAFWIQGLVLRKAEGEALTLIFWGLEMGLWEDEADEATMGF